MVSLDDHDASSYHTRIACRDSSVLFVSLYMLCHTIETFASSHYQQREPRCKTYKYRNSSDYYRLQQQLVSA